MDDIKFAKIRKNAVIPTREVYNAGLDIYCCFDEDYIVIEPNETKLIPTGIASAIPIDYYIQIQERGSSGSKGIKYSAGVIDSSYRGEWFLAATNTNKKPILIIKEHVISNTNRIYKELIQEAYIIYPYEKALFQGIVHNVCNEINQKEISFEELSKILSERGDGKLGSSNK